MHPTMNPNVQIDWSGCSLVERTPARMSNVPIVKGTRVQADSIVENFRGGSPIDEISENFFIPQTTIRELLAFAEGKDLRRT
jgi:uncharacterized protein (DUF433 family)